MAFSHSVGTRSINAAVFGAWKMILFFWSGGLRRSRAISAPATDR